MTWDQVVSWLLIPGGLTLLVAVLGLVGARLIP